MEIAITTSKTFQERITDRIRESIGELMTAEEAKALVECVIERDLLAKRIVRKGYGPAETLPSLFSTMVLEAVTPLVKEAIDDWIASNPDIIKEAIQSALDEGFLKAAYRALNAQFRSPMTELEGKLFQVISKIGGV